MALLLLAEAQKAHTESLAAGSVPMLNQLCYAYTIEACGKFGAVQAIESLLNQMIAHGIPPQDR